MLTEAVVMLRERLSREKKYQSEKDMSQRVIMSEMDKVEYTTKVDT